MITATVKADAVKAKLAYIISDMGTAVAIGVNSTMKKTRKELRKTLAKQMDVKMPAKAFKGAIRPKAIAAKSHLQATLALEKGRAISLRYFRPTQTKRDGTSVRMNNAIPGKAGRTFLPNAFVVKRLGNTVFERAYQGKGSKRLPIVQQFGPNFGQLMKAAGIKDMAVSLIRKELPKRIQRRIRFLLLKQSGGLRGNQPSRNQ